MNYKEAINQLNNNEIKKVYLLYGEEIYLRNQFIQQLKKIIVNKDFEDLNIYNIDGKDCSLEKLIDACETLPFMADKKLILVRDFEIFQSNKKIMSEEEEKHFIAYIEKIPQTTCLVFYGSNYVDARKKIVKEIQKHGGVVEFQKLNSRELKQWIINMVKGYGKEIGATEVEYLLENINYIGKNATQSLLDIENELKKIVSFIGERKKIILEDLERIFSSSFENDIFKLLDAIEKKQISKAIKHFNLMIYQGEPIIKIAATLGNHLRNLLKVKILLEEGYSSKAISSRIGLHPFVVSKCATQCKGFTVAELQELLNRFLKIDVSIKTGKIRDYIAIELFIIEICNNR